MKKIDSKEPEGKAYKKLVAYICDRKACSKCSYPECTRTTDINHARNFIRLESQAGEERWVEKDFNTKVYGLIQNGLR